MAKETIQERLVREEREAREKRLAEIKAEREARERAEAERKAAAERAAMEAEARRAEQARAAAEKAAADAAARKERNAALRAKEIDRLERAYVLYERAVKLMDELNEAERSGLNMGITHSGLVEKLRGSLVYNRDTARQHLINPAERFRYLHIDD